MVTRDCTSLVELPCIAFVAKIDSCSAQAGSHLDVDDVERDGNHSSQVTGKSVFGFLNQVENEAGFSNVGANDFVT